jgi:hypothetical protein
MCRSSEGARRRGGRCDASRLTESAAHVLGMGLSSYDEQRRGASRGPRIHGRSSGDRAFAHSIIVLIVVYKNNTSPPETMVAYQDPGYAVTCTPELTLPEVYSD